jgi:hypothetical protein
MQQMVQQDHLVVVVVVLVLQNRREQELTFLKLGYGKMLQLGIEINTSIVYYSIYMTFVV